MGDFTHRVTDALLRSEMLPVMFRMKFMRMAGYKVATNSCFWAGANLRSKRLTVGGNVFVNVGFFFDGFDTLTIGENVRIGQFVKIITATHQIGPPKQRGTHETIGKAVCIENGSWIGSCAIILPGVTVASGCVIAAASVVTKSTEPNGLYAGNPARLIRMLPGDGQEEPSLLLAETA
jgi:maltose O-acetyltransferase